MGSLILWPIPRTYKILALKLVIKARSRHRNQRAAVYFSFFLISLRSFLLFLAHKFALALSIEARSQTDWAAGFRVFFCFSRPNTWSVGPECGLRHSRVVSGLTGGPCHVVNYIKVSYLDRQWQDRAQATFLKSNFKKLSVVTELHKPARKVNKGF